MQDVVLNCRARSPWMGRALLALGIALIASPVLTYAADAPSQAAPAADGSKSPPSAQVRGVDGLIAHLHTVFKITPAQETLFQQLASVMREDARTMAELAKKRAESATSMTAVDDLKSYAAISQAHAEGTQKMIPVFTSLYDSMSDEQKKAADVEFREHYAARHR